MSLTECFVKPEVKHLPKFDIGDRVIYNGVECLVSDNFNNDSVYVRLSPLDEQGKDIGVCRRTAVNQKPQ